jgi:hypothetical protein
VNSHDSAESATLLSLSPWEAVLRRSEGRQRSLLQGPATALETLDALEVFVLLKNDDPDVAAQVVPRLSTEQLVALLDFDVWDGPQLQTADFLAWLETFQDSGPEILPRLLAEMDHQLLALLMRDQLAIGQPLDPESRTAHWLTDPPPPGSEVVMTPGDEFVLARRSAYEAGDPEEGEGEDSFPLVLRVVWDLFANGRPLGKTVFHLATHLSLAELEEASFGFRCARLEDWAVAPRARACELLHPLKDPVAVGRKPRPDGAQALMVLPWPHLRWIDREPVASSLRNVADAKVMRAIESELCWLSRLLLSREGGALSRWAQDPRAIQHLSTSLERGLRHMAQARDVDEAQVLIDYALIDVFRLGEGLVTI